MAKEIKIMLVVLGVVVIGIGAAVYFNKNGLTTPSITPVPESVLISAQSHMTGSASAKVQLVEFGDYECPACGAAEPIIEQIRNNYKNNPNFTFVFRNFPIVSIHANAMIGAEAAEAAGAQGKFWEMHDLLYQHQNDWADNASPIDLFAGYAQQLGLNVAQFKNDINSGRYASVINGDEQVGTNIGINSTPTFYLNGQIAVGVPDYNGLKSSIDSLLNAK